MHDVRSSGPMRDVRNLEGALRCVCVPFSFYAYVTHYYCINKPLKMCECNSVIVVMPERNY